MPAGLNGLCCGTPWSSKGLTRGRDRMRDRTCDALLTVTADRRLPVISNDSSCTEGLRGMLADDGFTVLDAIAFVYDPFLLQLID